MKWEKSSSTVRVNVGVYESVKKEKKEKRPSAFVMVGRCYGGNKSKQQQSSSTSSDVEEEEKKRSKKVISCSSIFWNYEPAPKVP